MKNEILYPTTIDNLLKKNEYLIENEQNENVINDLINWNKWFNSLKIDFIINLEENEYLKSYIFDDNYSLQVWIHTENVDSIRYNIITNHYSEFNNENTIIII